MPQFLEPNEQFTCLGVELYIMMTASAAAYRATVVELDGKLNGIKHTCICQKVSAGIAIMTRIKPYVPSKALQDIYNGLVMPYFDCCSSLWDTCGKERQHKIQKYQNRPAMQGYRWR